MKLPRSLFAVDNLQKRCVAMAAQLLNYIQVKIISTLVYRFVTHSLPFDPPTHYTTNNINMFTLATPTFPWDHHSKSLLGEESFVSCLHQMYLLINALHGNRINYI